MRYAVKALNEGQQDKAVSGLVLFWILAYSPCYNIGYNAMTYSEFSCPAVAIRFPRSR